MPESSITPTPTYSNMPSTVSSFGFGTGIKTAMPSIILENTIVDANIQALLNFESITSKELISILRNDLVSGRTKTNTPIKNLASLELRYGPKNIISLQGSSDSYFANFPIKLERKIPDVGTGPNGAVVYIDQDTNDLVVNIQDLADDERVEIQIMKRGNILNDTIYGEGNI
jgi:hypothetical protein